MKALTQIEPTPVEGIITMFPLLSDLKKLRDEDLMNLKMVPVDLAPGENDVLQSANHFKINGSPIVPEIAEIHIEEFIDLFTDAIKMKSPGARYVTGIHVHYACKNNKFLPLYQPICMEWQRYDGTGQNDVYKILGKGDKHFYNPLAVGKKFEIVSTTDADSWIADYQSPLVTIKHNDLPGTGFTSFIKDHDVEGLIFPFQTIFAIIHDNASESVKLSNAIEEVRYDGNLSIKHRILLFSESFPVKPLTNKYANRSHLCPPCNAIEVGYDLA